MIHASFSELRRRLAHFMDLGRRTIARPFSSRARVMNRS